MATPERAAGNLLWWVAQTSPELKSPTGAFSKSCPALQESQVELQGSLCQSLPRHPMSQEKSLRTLRVKERGIKPHIFTEGMSKSLWPSLFLHPILMYWPKRKSSDMDGISTSWMKVYGVSRTSAGARSHWSEGIGLESNIPGFETRYTTYWVTLSQLLKLTESQGFCLSSGIIIYSRAIMWIPSINTAPAWSFRKCSCF